MVAVRRWLGAGAVVVLGAGLGVQPTAAHASVTLSRLVATTSATGTGDAACAPTGFTGPAADLALPPDGRERLATADRTGHAGASDLRGIAVIRGRVSGDARGTTRVGLRATANGSATPTGASNVCTVTLRTTAMVDVDVTVARPSWLVVGSAGRSAPRADSARGGIELLRWDGTFDLFVPMGKSLTRLVAPGDYNLSGGLDTTLAVPTRTTGVLTVSGSIDGTADLFPIGTLRKHSGKARAYIRAGHRDCAGRQVTMTLTPKAAAKARRITLAVNGKRAKVLTGKALRRASVRLTKIPARSNGAISATVVTRSGAVRKMSATSWPCA